MAGLPGMIGEKVGNSLVEAEWEYVCIYSMWGIIAKTSGVPKIATKQWNSCISTESKRDFL